MLSTEYATKYPQRLPTPARFEPLGYPDWARAASQQISTLDALVRHVTPRLDPLPHWLPEGDDRGRPAAVIVPLIEIDGEPGILFIRRSWRIRRHRGEVAFPGGGVETGETYVQAALRECEEEVQVPSDRLNLIGALGLAQTFASGSTFYRILAQLDDHTVAGPSEEVDELLPVRLSTLLDESCLHVERWDFSNGRTSEMYFFELENDLLWGASARMIADLCRLFV
ncbi:MAG: NUDIX hydrolase [Acidimicrobiales bacterium]